MFTEKAYAAQEALMPLVRHAVMKNRAQFPKFEIDVGIAPRGLTLNIWNGTSECRRFLPMDQVEKDRAIVWASDLILSFVALTAPPAIP
jgi:hypothetical protein